MANADIGLIGICAGIIDHEDSAVGEYGRGGKANRVLNKLIPDALDGFFGDYLGGYSGVIQGYFGITGPGFATIGAAEKIARCYRCIEASGSGKNYVRIFRI